MAATMYEALTGKEPEAIKAVKGTAETERASTPLIAKILGPPTLSPAQASRELKLIRARLIAHDALKQDIELFDQLVDFTIAGLNPDPKERLAIFGKPSFRGKLSPILRLSSDGQRIIGPAPDFLSRGP